MSKNEVKSKLRDIVQIPSDAVETEFSSETVVYKKKDGYYTFATVITFTYENNEQIINGNAIVDLKLAKYFSKKSSLKTKRIRL